MEDLEKESDILEEASVTETLLDSPAAESYSEGSDGDRPENASSTKSKKDPRTPEIYHKKSSRVLLLFMIMVCG